jgi:hypothetical protein
MLRYLPPAIILSCRAKWIYRSMLSSLDRTENKTNKLIGGVEPLGRKYSVK